MARVGIDCDGVLYPFDEELKKALVRHGTRLPEECSPPTKWEFFDDWDMTREFFVHSCNKYTNSGDLFWKGNPYPGVRTQLERLAEAGHEIILITNRNFGDKGVVQGATGHWLRTHRIPYVELHFVKDKTTVDVDYHIDDNVDNHLAMFYAGVRSFLLTQPWNEGTSQPNRVDSLEEYVDHILGIDAERPELTFAPSEVRVTSSTGGQKGSKQARFDLLPPSLWEVAELYGKGAEKYDAWNWRKGYDWSLSYAALQRHANLFWDGQDYDEETGAHHMTSVVFHALALLTFGKEHPDFDDRYTTPSG